MQGKTTYGGLSAALCLEGARRLLLEDGGSLPPLRSASVAFVGAAGGEEDTFSALGMIPDTDTIGRLCEMTGGYLFDRTVLRAGLAAPADVVFSTGGASAGQRTIAAQDSIDRLPLSMSSMSLGSSSSWTPPKLSGGSMGGVAMPSAFQAWM